jgi:hypothetical protein
MAAIKRLSGTGKQNQGDTVLRDFAASASGGWLPPIARLGRVRSFFSFSGIAVNEDGAFPCRGVESQNRRSAGGFRARVCAIARDGEGWEDSDMEGDERQQLLAELLQEIETGLRDLQRGASIMNELTRRGFNVRREASTAESRWQQTVACTDVLEKYGVEVASIRTKLEEIRVLAGFALLIPPSASGPGMRGLRPVCC